MRKFKDNNIMDDYGVLGFCRKVRKVKKLKENKFFDDIYYNTNLLSLLLIISKLLRQEMREA